MRCYREKWKLFNVLIVFHFLNLRIEARQINGNKPFSRVPKGIISSCHLPSTVFRDSREETSNESASMPPVVPGCRQMSAHTTSQMNTRTADYYYLALSGNNSCLPSAFKVSLLKPKAAPFACFSSTSCNLYMLTKLSVLSDLQLTDAVCDDCARWDLQGNVTVRLDVCVFLHTHLGGGRIL